MKLSVSNIGWQPNQTLEAIALLKKYGIQYIDIAPTLLNEEIEKIIPCAQLDMYREANLKFQGMQSLLYSCPAGSLFDSNKDRDIIFNHLEKIFRVAKKLNINNVIFGSPKYRFIKNKSDIKKAVSIFTEMTIIAEKYNCIICLEANPEEYNCNFITNTSDAINFINQINREHFKLNLDVSTTILKNENLEDIFKNINLIEHVHISAPYLKSILTIENKKIAYLLNHYKYNKTIALEYKASQSNSLKELEENIKIFTQEYNNISK